MYFLCPRCFYSFFIGDGNFVECYFYLHTLQKLKVMIFSFVQPVPTKPRTPLYYLNRSFTTVLGGTRPRTDVLVWAASDEGTNK